MFNLGQLSCINATQTEVFQKCSNITQKQRCTQLHLLMPSAALPAQVPDMPKGYIRKPIYNKTADFSCEQIFLPSIPVQRVDFEVAYKVAYKRATAASKTRTKQSLTNMKKLSAFISDFFFHCNYIKILNFAKPFLIYSSVPLMQLLMPSFKITNIFGHIGDTTLCTAIFAN